MIQTEKEKKEIFTDFSPEYPEHYHHGGIDVFKYMQANKEKDRVAGFFEGNIIKYITRYNRKNGVEDLKKAEIYLKALIALESESQSE